MIEEQLARLSAAIEALNITIAQGHAAVDARGRSTGEVQEDPKPKASAPRVAKKEITTPTSTTEEASVSTETETTAEISSGDIDYERDVKPLILKVGGSKGRDAALALLAEFEVKGGTELEPDVYPAFIARAKELLA